MRDWHQSLTKVGEAALEDEGQERWEKLLGTFLSYFGDPGSDGGAAASTSLGDAGVSKNHPLEAVDHALQATAGLSLSSFVAGKPLRALRAGERRYMVA